MKKHPYFAFKVLVAMGMWFIFGVHAAQKPLYFVTGNVGKLDEVRAVLPQVQQFDIDLEEIQELDAKKVIEAKVLQAFKQEVTKRPQGPIMIEDTSLYFDVLNGLPGPLIKWFMKAIGNEGLYKIALAFNNFNAEAKTIIGYSEDGDPKNIKYFEGSMRGTIVHPSEGAKGVFGKIFGWDPLFKPQGSEKTFAQMSTAEKNAVSMRGMAVQKLKNYLKLEEPEEELALSKPIESTFAMIKPNAFEHRAEIKDMIRDAGFTIGRCKELQLAEADVNWFYAEHAGKEWFKRDMIPFLTQEGPVVLLELIKDNAIADWRKLAGPTDPAKARMEAPESIRARFGLKYDKPEAQLTKQEVSDRKLRNAVHGSDSPESAQREREIFVRVTGRGADC